MGYNSFVSLYKRREELKIMIESASGYAAEKISREKLVQDLKAVVNDAEELLRATAQQTGEKVAVVRAKAEESLKAAKARIAEEGEAVVARAKFAAKTADDFVKENPWQAVGIGALAGLVIGILISRR
jgi:ElaB/YqjD/DUF883 family membrane-anchored ribosome-binding protein